MAPSSSGPGQMVLSHQIEGSNPFGATKSEAENYLCGGFPLFSFVDPAQRPPNLENGVPASRTTSGHVYLSFRRFSLNLGNGVKARSKDDLREFLDKQECG